MIYNSILRQWVFTKSEKTYFDRYGLEIDEDYNSCCRLLLLLNTFKSSGVSASLPSSKYSTSIDSEEEDKLIISQQAENIFFYLLKIIEKHKKYILMISLNNRINYIDESNEAKNISFELKTYTVNDLIEILNQEVLDEKIERTICALSDSSERILIAPHEIRKDGSCIFRISSK